MKHLDEYRDPVRLRQKLRDVRELCTRKWIIMDVCGGQTHNLLRHGIEEALADCIELIHGPGCPVCVTPAAVIDDAIDLARRGIIVASFGDMLRVPGTSASLLQTRAKGGDVRIVYSPLDAVQIARENPQREVAFLAVGFETTAPSSALAILHAKEHEISNFSVLSHHVRVEPAMRALTADSTRRLQGFLAAGHVCTVTGYAELESLSNDFNVPVVVTGFEPLDLAEGILACVRQLEIGWARVENCYPRCVQREGNRAAQQLIQRVFKPCEMPWRGFGTISLGGFELRSEYGRFDARQRFSISAAKDCESPGVEHCSLVLSGRLGPIHCPLFGSVCTPEAPLGAPMVSSEGACAAYFRYSSNREPACV